jgi:hypothetical protein
MGPYYSAFGGGHYWAVGLLLMWALPWKAWSMWIAAKKGQKAWFVALLALNTAGLLEILYIFVFSKHGEKTRAAAKQE